MSNIKEFKKPKSTSDELRDVEIESVEEFLQFLIHNKEHIKIINCNVVFKPEGETTITNRELLTYREDATIQELEELLLTLGQTIGTVSGDLINAGSKE